MPDVVTIEPLTVKRTRVVQLAHALTALAVIATSITVLIVVLVVGTDRDGWRKVAGEVSAENEQLREAVQEQTLELECRSVAQAAQDSAMGELTINIGATAEAALRFAARQPGDQDRTIAEIADALSASSQAVRDATIARDLAFEDCSQGGS